MFFIDTKRPQVKICDAIMGSGKTSATITYINSHPEKRFLYITPYLPEAKRVADGCPNAGFIEPSEKKPEYGFSKSKHALSLIETGMNVASTHQAMLYFTSETFEKLREMNYCVIIDEEISVLQEAEDITYEDVKMAEAAGYVTEDRPGEYVLTGKEYGHGKFTHMFRMMASRPLICMTDTTKKDAGKYTKLWYWAFSTELFKQVEEVIILTYLFKDSELDMFLRIHGFEYSIIGIRRTEDGGYEFSDKPDYVPEYTKHLKEMIHIENSDKLNAVGTNFTALSKNWFHTKDDEVITLKNNIYNFFRHKTKSKSNERMCGKYKEHWGKIRNKGYWNSDVVFTQKSSNEYRDRFVLVYPVNLFANRHIRNYYAEQGCNYSDDHYALSTMVQWIWRSAIRDGKEIYIYIPSKRMRDLLINWIEEVSQNA